MEGVGFLSLFRFPVFFTYLEEFLLFFFFQVFFCTVPDSATIQDYVLLFHIYILVFVTGFGSRIESAFVTGSGSRLK